jgi:hypothetical protein
MEGKMADTRQMEIFNADEEPPSKKELSAKMDSDGGRRCDFNLFFYSVIFHSRNNIQPKWIVPEILAGDGNHHAV